MDNAKKSVDRFTPPVKGCQFCDHAPGLAVLPVRYAVVGPEDKVGAPTLSGNFKIENAPAQLGGGAQYTLRTMRPGFLYVFHEALQLWESYLVVNGGHLWKIIPERPAPPRSPDEFFCSMGIGHGYTSMYFTIPDAKNATTVWYAYSHVQWTQAQLDENKSRADVRRQHMQSLNVQTWLASHKAPHAARVTELSQHVASYAMPPEAQDKAFQYLSAPPRTKAGNRLDLIGLNAGAILSETMERVSPGDALMLAFEDPKGIIKDLAALTSDKMHASAVNSVIWDKTTDFLLDRLQANLEAQVIQQMTREEQDRRTETDAEGRLGYELLSAMFAYEKTKARWAREDAEREATRQKRESDAKTAAWKPYADVLDNSKRHRNHTARLKTLNETVLAPIAQSHSQWLTSGQFTSYMTHRHDRMDLAHGYHYNEALTRCIEGALDTVECRKVIKRWYEDANPQRDSNLLARALYLNYQPAINTVADATDAAYGAMLAVFRSGLDAMDGLLDRGLSLTAAVTKLNLVPRLAWVLSDEIIPALANKLGSKTASMYIHGLSLFGGVRIVNADRSVMQLRASTLDDLKAQNPKLYGQLGRSQRREEAVAFARQAQRMARNARLVWFDPKDLAKTTGLGALELRTTADVPGVKHVKAALGSPHVNIGAIACILQGVAVYHATQSFRAAGEFDEAEKGTKLMGGLVTMVGTLAEQAGVAVSKAPTHPLVARTMRATPQEAWVTKGEKLALKGRWIGFAGATVAVGWDGYHSVDEYMKGNRLVALLYGASSISGLAAATIPLATENFLPFLFGAPVWPALVILLGVNVGLAMLDDPATLKWVQKCRFAKRPDPDKYHSMEAEWKEFVQLGIQVKDEGMQ